ncbi:putative N-acetylmannosamine-6-phosphate 2-epimerase [Buttiauxella sp. A2-C2_NF]|uniref:N-acetylmannosamine-6-phosphate 2-epimerase n=1 Tax=Enterobacterales TaxID=91347 RepID=UPI001E4EBE81|nr:MULTISPECIES: putative N-acetylmannosamine-6-phosphate 2-epimerase [Enterobacterales]MCE0827154.1 putative N-acetylmannosamine-6-phosphate 2-epimerase [Buttiauxella ferragutiae]UNK63101.1 putative N-acetylmannosamine-6-phosphate 2-epimerase [Buttiauxella ferragutiae]CAI0842538.1 Putative N-acetylmannosamine-6-phosphate 2-epimerase [Serratia quinivorans]CAI1605165.1 Putative N-acetylmannosamine-6-phosphate 2-epimerase [Serratia quinivorans]
MAIDINRLKDQLIVSCQPVTDGPMDSTDIVVAMARSAELAGAGAVRIEGVDNVRQVSRYLDIPVIGIVKRDLDDSPVRITPFLNDVSALIVAGASVIAIDATDRTRPVPIAELYQLARQSGVLVMADCSTLAEGIAAAELGFDLIGTTLSGYTEETTSQPMDRPDIELISELAERGYLVMAEGRTRTPTHAAAALKAGAFAVTVGSAITRVEHITEWYNSALAEVINGRTPT